MNLDRLDAEVGGPMLVALAGEILTLPAAAELSWREMIAASTSRQFFHALVWPKGVRVSVRLLDQVRPRWVSHNGLTDQSQTQRLVYMFSKYYSGIEYDLQHHLGVSAGQLWRDRQWRVLLGYIDQLPGNSHMNRLLSSDEEYMENLIRNQGESSGPGKPSMAEWSLTNSLLSTMIDELRRNTATQIAIANPKGPKPRVDPMPRPATAAELVRRKIQKESHEHFVGILLPNRQA